jgi:hypothetical protein
VFQWAQKLVDTPEKCQQRCARILVEAGLPYVRDVVIPDNVGSYTQIDHLLLTPTGLVMLEWQYFSGVLHGSAHAQEWTRFDGKERHDFPNPLRRVQQLGASLDALVLGSKVGVPIEGFLVLTGTAKFAKGLPQGVMDEAALRAWLAAQSLSIPVRQQTVWNVLLSRVACEPVTLLQVQPVQ